MKNAPSVGGAAWAEGLKKFGGAPGSTAQALHDEVVARGDRFVTAPIELCLFPPAKHCVEVDTSSIAWKDDDGGEEDIKDEDIVRAISERDEKLNRRPSSSSSSSNHEALRDPTVRSCHESCLRVVWLARQETMLGEIKRSMRASASGGLPSAQKKVAVRQLSDEEFEEMFNETEDPMVSQLEKLNKNRLAHSLAFASLGAEDHSPRSR